MTVACLSGSEQVENFVIIIIIIIIIIFISNKQQNENWSVSYATPVTCQEKELSSLIRVHFNLMLLINSVLPIVWKRLKGGSNLMWTLHLPQIQNNRNKANPVLTRKITLAFSIDAEMQ